MYKYYVEKRKHKRIPAVILVDLYTPDNSLYLGRGCITDISFGGMQIETKEKIDESNVSLKFFLSTGVKFENIHARIVRTTKTSFTYIYGLKFLSMNLFDKLRLWLFIHTKLWHEKK
jgi:c-di-GMP-binding flagellar brake protein YcgR